MNNILQRKRKNKISYSLAMLLFILLITYINNHVTTIEITDNQITVYSETIYYDIRNINTSSDIGNSQLYLGKICLGNDNTTVNQCINDYESYSHTWILLVSDQAYFNDLKYFINTDKYTRIKAVIANNNTINTEIINQREFNFPLFWCNQTIYDTIKQYNAIEEKDNYYATLLYQSIYSGLINQIAFYMIILLLLINALIFCWWILWLHKYRNYLSNNTTTIQLLLKFFVGFRVILSVVYVYYFDNRKKQQIKKPINLISIYINVILMGLNSVDISLFWLFLLLISNGWFIYKASFTNIQARRVALLYIVFFGFVIFDEVINILIKMNLIGSLKISDLKNAILYTVLIEMCRRFSIETLNTLKRKYTYAYSYSNEFLQPLRLKITLIKWHLGICVAYYILNILQIGILKTMIRDDKIVELLWGYVEMIVMISLIIVNRPMNFSYYYFVYNEGNRDELINDYKQQFIYIFRYKLIGIIDENANKKYSCVISSDSFNKKEIETIQHEENYPIIILPPYDNSNNNYGIGFFNYNPHNSKKNYYFHEHDEDNDENISNHNNHLIRNYYDNNQDVL